MKRLIGLMIVGFAVIGAMGAGAVTTPDEAASIDEASALLYESALEGESSPEIATETQVVTDGATTDTYPLGQVIWTYTIDTSWDNSPKAIGSIADINSDGIDDVIVCSEDDYVRCLDGAAVGTGVVLWEHEITAGDIYSQKGLVVVADVDSDGIEDVVVGATGGARLIRCISGADGSTVWTHDTHEYGSGGWVYQIHCRFDYNDDGVKDVLAATGDDSSDTGPKRIYCLNGLTGVSIWEYYLGGAGFAVVGVEDFTGDGQADVVAGATNASETIGYVYGINGATGGHVWTFTANGSSVWALEQIDDLNSDSVRDVIVGDFSGYIFGLDATNGGLVYSSSIAPAIITRFESLKDVNGDTHPDIVPAHSSSHVTQAIDGMTGSFIWTRAVADQPWNVARSADITGDSVDDLFVGTLFGSNYCYYLDGSDGSVLYSLNYGTAVDAIAAIPDVTGDNSMELVAGGRNGLVTCFSGGFGVVVTDPPGAPSVSGPVAGGTGTAYEYDVSALDPDDDNVYYFVDWGDGSTSGWLGPYASGAGVEVTHTWVRAGSYPISVKAKDIWDAEGEWSTPHEVLIIGERQTLRHNLFW